MIFRCLNRRTNAKFILSQLGVSGPADFALFTQQKIFYRIFKSKYDTHYLKFLLPNNRYFPDLVR